MEKKKEYLKTIFTKGIKNEKVLLALLGIALLIVLCIPVSNEPKEEEQEKPDINATDYYTWYQSYLEQRIESVLNSTSEIGSVKVMITLKNTTEKVLETEGREDDKNVVREENSGRKVPYVVQEKLPEVAGVVIVAKNGDNPVIISEITQAVEALLSVSMHRIKVLKMK